MDTLDLTKPKGLPLTQNRLKFMQDSYVAAIGAITGMAHVAANVAAVLSGMVSTAAGGGVTNVSAGWFLFNGELIKFPAQSYPALTGGNDMYVVITRTATPLTFKDGSTPNVVLGVTGVLTELVNTTPTDATHFLLSAVVKWGIAATVEQRALSNDDFIDFKRNRTIIYAARGFAACTINLDFTNAIPGTVQYLLIPAGVSSAAFGLAGTGMAYVIDPDPYLGFSSLNNTAIRVTYIGSVGGTHYVIPEGWEY